jgi:hypothetical protein
MENKLVNVEKISDKVVYKLSKIDALNGIKKLLASIDEIEKRVWEKLAMLGYDSSGFERGKVIDFICAEMEIYGNVKTEIEKELADKMDAMLKKREGEKE